MIANVEAIRCHPKFQRCGTLVDLTKPIRGAPIRGVQVILNVDQLTSNYFDCVMNPCDTMSGERMYSSVNDGRGGESWWEAPAPWKLVHSG